MKTSPELNVSSLSYIENTQSLGFISVKTGDGVTTSAISTAYSLRENLSANVLLVDMDFQYPCLHTMFDLPVSPGLCDIVSDSSIPARQFIHEVDENVSVVTIGDDIIALNKKTVFSEFRPLLQRFTDGFDYVLCDIGSIDELASMNRTISLLNGVVLVICCERTTWESAQDVKGKLEVANVPVVGVILNQRKYYLPRWLYNSL